MFKEFFLFELSYRKNRSATYIYFGIAFLLCFLGVASPVIKLGSTVGLVKANAPYIIFRMMVVTSFALSIISSAIMGVSILRDRDHNFEAILFSTPIKKWDYLMGRFWGSCVTLIIINSGVILGFVVGFAIGRYMPWDVSWKNETIYAFNIWSYLHPFFTIILPNLFFTSALFFMSGALGRNSVVIYSQGIALLVIYQLGNNFLREIDSQYMASLVDPFAVQTFLYVTRYWTPAEQNKMFVPLGGVMLYNRIIWIGVGILALLVTNYFFSFNVSHHLSLGKKKNRELIAEKAPKLTIPLVKRRTNTPAAYMMQILRLSFFYFKIVWKETAFMVIVGSGVLITLLNGIKINSVYGTSSYPTTSILVDSIANSFNLFAIIIVIFYVGELVWKERSVNFNQISDTLPITNFVSLFSKFSGLLFIYASLMVMLIVCGIAIQAMHGYYSFEMPIYLKAFFGSMFTGLALFSLPAILVQVIVNNKFTGFVLTIALVILNAMLNYFGFQHSLWKFGSGDLGLFSDMNSFGHFVTPFIWFKIYWFSISLMLFVVASLFLVRNVELTPGLRLKMAVQRMKKPILLFGGAMTCLFVFSGFYIFYNTNIVNRYEGTDDLKKKLAYYELDLKKYEQIPQPEIIEVNLNVDLYPSSRDFSAEGFYYLKNKSEQGIKDVHIQYMIDHQLKIDYLKFERDAKIKESFDDYHHYIYELGSDLMPGDSVKIRFRLSFETKGFVESVSNTDVVYNGTFITNAYFPSIGYNRDIELSDPKERKTYGLPDRKHLPKPNGLSRLGNNSRVRLDITSSTEQNQVIIAPGALLGKRERNKRRYFHYKMDAPIENLYSIVSGCYEIKKDQWKGIMLEIYYRQGHEQNLDRMMNGMKDALTYCSENYGPYQYNHLRIVEFPRYRNFAQSCAGIIPFSEGASFMLKPQKGSKDFDMAYLVTAHQVAQQWWAHQLIGADVKGSKLMSEGLSQYSAMMVMKHSFAQEMQDGMENFLKFELDNYLKGRTQEREKEEPLESIENQPYLYGNKASIVFYALQDYIGEGRLNEALRNFLSQWRNKENQFPSSTDLIDNIRKVTPDSLQYYISDAFTNVTLYENKAFDAVYKENKLGKYEITFTALFEKTLVDTLGIQRIVSLNDWFDIGVFDSDENGNERLLYLRKHKIRDAKQIIKLFTDKKPTHITIDPFHKLIDRNTGDNSTEVKQFVDITSLPLDF